MHNKTTVWSVRQNSYAALGSVCPLQKESRREKKEKRAERRAELKRKASQDIRRLKRPLEGKIASAEDEARETKLEARRLARELGITSERAEALLDAGRGVDFDGDGFADALDINGDGFIDAFEQSENQALSGGSNQTVEEFEGELQDDIEPEFLTDVDFGQDIEDTF